MDQEADGAGGGQFCSKRPTVRLKPGANGRTWTASITSHRQQVSRVAWLQWLAAYWRPPTGGRPSMFPSADEGSSGRPSVFLLPAEGSSLFSEPVGLQSAPRSSAQINCFVDTIRSLRVPEPSWLP